MELPFRVARTASVQTPLTCNCLLPVCSEHVTAPPLHDKPAATSDTSDACTLHAASYELLLAAEDHDDARHVGDCAVYTADLDADTHCCSSLHLQCSSTRDGVPSLPGVFDLASVPACFMAHLQPTSDAPHFLLMASTDGSVRVADPATLANVVAPFAGIHSEMITSCTPFISGGLTGSAAVPRLLCSAHTGAVVLYSLAERCVTHELEGHEFDAWCTAALPTSGWWTAAAPEPSSDGEEEASSSSGGNNGGVGVLNGAPLLASGGDDSLLKLYDVRCGCRRATARTRLGAGVVSITPVLDTSNESSSGSDAGGRTAFATPYLVVGSYDESISLFDVRAMRRPVAQRTGLGGGVWRTSRCLYSLWGGSSGEAATPPTAEGETDDATLRLMLENALGSHTTGWVNTSNVLVLPLMQRGAALLPYDVRAAADQVFGDAPLQHFFAEEEDANPLTLPLLTERSLVYDTAVLRPVAAADASAVVATTSFYENRIDVWSVRPVRGV